MGAVRDVYLVSPFAVPTEAPMTLLIFAYLLSTIPLTVLVTRRWFGSERSRTSPPRSAPRGPLKSTLPLWTAKRLVEH